MQFLMFIRRKQSIIRERYSIKSASAGSLALPRRGFAKKGDIHRAEKCFQLVLKMGEENTIILRDLAVLELKFVQVSENPAQHVEESIKYAQRMLVLDDKDGNCLYILGSAYFTYFLLSGGRYHDNLQLALETFEKAVNRYLENYKMSLKGFSDAASMNPACDALHQRELTLQLLDNLEGLLQIKQGDQVTLLDSICKFVDFEWEGKHYQFKSVRVNLLEQVLVNGNPLPNSAIPKPISYPKLRAIYSCLLHADV